MNGPLVLGIGEFLWDLFPQGPRLGGAPGNFAYHASCLGCRGVLATRVGADGLGREAVARLEAMGVDRRCVQVDRSLPTGTVQVAVDALGQPSYTIHENVAWDAIAFEGALPALARQAQAVCFGTLASRAPRTRETVRRCLAAARGSALRIFDVNLRKGCHTPALIREFMGLCDVVKLNEDELPLVAAACGLPGNPESLREHFGLKLLALTLGAQGSHLYVKGHRLVEHGVPLKVQDAVGAGDSFTAALAAGLVQGWGLEETHRCAARISAFVCTQVGSTPDTSSFLDLVKLR